MSACPCTGHPHRCFSHPHDCGCTDEIDRLRARLAEAERERDENEGAFKVWRRRCGEAEARLAEAERTRACELAYVAEACKAASLSRCTHEARDAMLELRAWARSRASVSSASDSASAILDKGRG